MQPIFNRDMGLGTAPRSVSDGLTDGKQVAAGGRRL